MRLVALVLASMVVLSADTAAQTNTPGTGVPLEIAEARARAISDLRYGLTLTIPATVTQPIHGSNVLSFTLKDAAVPLVIDFATSREHVRAITANERETPVEWVNGHIVIPARALRAGANVIRVEFTAGDASLNRNPDFLYALFVPARAHLAIPCFDQPDLKARWSLRLTVPDQWLAVSNGGETLVRVTLPGSLPPGKEGTIPPPTRDAHVGQFEYVFAETEPLSTYLFSFVAGDFKLDSAERNGRTFRMFHRETDAVKVARNREAIFDLHASALAFMEQYTAIPYAFGKFDFVLIPAFQFGGMEHAGKILYNASGLFLDESATQNQHLGRASVIAHETAHMWFGDLVTMRWFNDVWMKEVFANFMAAKIVNPSFPEVNHELRFLLSHYPSAYGVDRTAGANAIRQPLANLNEAGSLYGAIIYQKAPIVMRHLEQLMGEETFRDGLRGYLKRHAFGNATWADLIALLDTRTPTDLADWSRVWVEEPGRPTIETTLDIADGKIRRLSFTQRAEHAGLQSRPSAWTQQLRVAIGYRDAIRQLTVDVAARESVVATATGMPAPLFVLPAGQGWGYGRFRLDARSLSYLSASLADVADPLTRGAALVTLWDALLESEISPTALVDLLQVVVVREGDEQLTSRALGYLGNTWWRFLTPRERTARVVALEETLRRGLAAAKTPGQKSAWFGALRDVFATPETTAWMRRVWDKSEQVPGLPLAEADYTALALELAVREVDGWQQLLLMQLGRIENPDRKARFEFVMPALSADSQVRERWFVALRDVANRRREPWVLEGLSYLHHPLRAQASAQYVKPSLELLRDIQRTGDIFFPTRWMASTLSGHSSEAVATTVRDFLAALPADYPPRLRNTILVAADDLFRAARRDP